MLVKLAAYFSSKVHFTVHLCRNKTIPGLIKGLQYSNIYKKKQLNFVSSDQPIMLTTLAPHIPLPPKISQCQGHTSFRVTQMKQPNSIALNSNPHTFVILNTYQLVSAISPMDKATQFVCSHIIYISTFYYLKGLFLHNARHSPESVSRKSKKSCQLWKSYTGIDCKLCNSCHYPDVYKTIRNHYIAARLAWTFLMLQCENVFICLASNHFVKN